MRSPDVITKLPEHFKTEADNLKRKYGFEFQVVAYRKISASEMRQAFLMWRKQQRSENIPRNKIITVQALYGFDGL